MDQNLLWHSLILDETDRDTTGLPSAEQAQIQKAGSRGFLDCGDCPDGTFGVLFF
jgi:hypothetical protein